MKSWGLTVSIPVEGDRCDKNCPYCISKMTGFVDSNPELVERNLDKVYHRAMTENIEVFMITSKREPTLNMEMVCKMADRFRNLPVELQTNGINLSRNPDLVETLYQSGVNTIAFSVDQIKQLLDYQGLFRLITRRGMMVRICINFTDLISPEFEFEGIFEMIERVADKEDGKKTGNIRQLLFRNVSIPSGVNSGRQYEWIKKHTSQDRYLKLCQEFDRIVLREGRKPLMTLPFDNTKVWDHKGISVVFSDYCIQETNNTKNVRSLIYLEDGHLYTSWSSPASIIF